MGGGRRDGRSNNNNNTCLCLYPSWFKGASCVEHNVNARPRDHRGWQPRAAAAAAAWRLGSKQRARRRLRGGQRAARGRDVDPIHRPLPAKPHPYTDGRRATPRSRGSHTRAWWRRAASHLVRCHRPARANGAACLLGCSAAACVDHDDEDVSVRTCNGRSRCTRRRGYKLILNPPWPECLCISVPRGESACFLRPSGLAASSSQLQNHRSSSLTLGQLEGGTRAEGRRSRAPGATLHAARPCTPPQTGCVHRV